VLTNDTMTDLPQIPTPHCLDVLERIAHYFEKAANAGWSSPTGKPDASTFLVRMIAGLELGVPPVTAIYQLAPEGGNLGVTSAMKVGLVRRRGLGQIRLVKSTTETAIVEIRREDWPEDKWAQVEYSVEDAKAAGLMGKRNWQQNRKDMLVARAHARAVNAHFQDSTLGIGYTYDELELSYEDDSISDILQESPEHTQAGEQASPRPHGDDRSPSEPATVEPPSPSGTAGEDIPAQDDPSPATLHDGTDYPTSLGRSDLKQRIPQLMPTDIWKRVVAKRWGKSKIDELDPDEVTGVTDWLNDIDSCQELRKMIGLNDDQWERAVAKYGEGKKHIAELEDSQLEQLLGKLMERADTTRQNQRAK
jgi:hypothetical protein